MPTTRAPWVTLVWLAAAWPAWGAEPLGQSAVQPPAPKPAAGTLADAPAASASKRKPRRRFHPISFRGTLVSEDASGKGAKTPETAQLQPSEAPSRSGRFDAHPGASATLEIPAGEARLEASKAFNYFEGKGPHQGEADQPPGVPSSNGLAAKR